MRKVLVLLLMGILAASASAGITAYSGAIVAGLNIPADLTLGALESDENIYIFAEKQDVLLTAPLDLDVWQTSLAPDIRVNSYIVHADKVGNQGMVHLVGSVTFDSPILGLIIKTDRLNATDALLGNDSTQYENQNHWRGLEGHDTVEIAMSGDQLTMSFKIYGALDEMRIIEAAPTAQVPAPGALLLGTLGTGLVGWLRRRRAM